MIRRSGLLPCLVLVFAWLLSHSSSACAEAADLLPDAGGVGVGGELAYSADEQVSSTARLGLAQLSLAYALDARWVLTADLALALSASIPEQGESDVVLSPGNPTLLAYLRFTPEWAFGAGFALPLADLGDGSVARLHRVAYNAAAAARGLARVWLWSPGRAAAVTTAQWRGRIGSQLGVEAELWPSLLWRARSGVGGNAVDLVAPSAVTLFLAGSALQPGVGLSAVWLLTNQVDRLQTAIEPQLRLRLARVAFEVRYLVSLDEPLGGPRGLRPWALHVAGGGTL